MFKLGEKEENSHHDDYHKVLLGSEDQEIAEKKPPNEKIIDFKIAESNSDKQE